MLYAPCILLGLAKRVSILAIFFCRIRRFSALAHEVFVQMPPPTRPPPPPPPTLVKANSSTSSSLDPDQYLSSSSFLLFFLFPPPPPTQDFTHVCIEAEGKGNISAFKFFSSIPYGKKRVDVDKLALIRSTSLFLALLRECGVLAVDESRKKREKIHRRIFRLMYFPKYKI